jgi:O-antigen ligase
MSARRRAPDWIPVLVLLLLALAPLLAGAVHEPVFIPLLVGCGVVGLASLARARRNKVAGAELLPGGWLLVSLHALVVVQLVPLPPALLRNLSPGSFSFYNDPLLVPLTAWKPVSVSPPDTLRGLAFLAAFSLLALAVFRELGTGRWRRRLLRTVVYVGLALTVVALLQAVSSEPRRIYGLWQPRWDWAVFGPYVNRNHFAGYMVMASALAVGFALEALSRLRAAWVKRRRGWLTLGDSEGLAFVRAAALVMVVVAGLVASASRGGVTSFALASLVLPLAARERRRTALAVALLVALGAVWIGLGGVITAFETRGVRTSRLELWQDVLTMVPRFPVLGVGWNAFASAYPWYQTIWRTDWIGEAHNDYLQALVDGGVIGAALVVGLLVVVFRGALARAALAPVELGVFGALLGLAFHEIVDFNGQIPANAAAWIALAALAVVPPPEVSRATHALAGESRDP